MPTMLHDSPFPECARHLFPLCALICAVLSNLYAISCLINFCLFLNSNTFLFLKSLTALPSRIYFFLCSSSTCLPKYFIAIYWYAFVPKYKKISKTSSVHHLFTGNILVECFPYIMYCLLSEITIMHKYTNTLCSWNIFHWWREKTPKVKCIRCRMEIGQKAWLVDGKWAKRCFSR